MGAGVTPAAGTVTVWVARNKIREGQRLAASDDWARRARTTLSALHGACRFSSLARVLAFTATLNARKRRVRKKSGVCMMG